MKYVEPEVELGIFTCPICNAISGQRWNAWNIEFDVDSYELKSHMNTVNKIRAQQNNNEIDVLRISTCDACQEYLIWVDDKIIFPRVVSIPIANEDMPENVKVIYDEAREVHSISKKSAAALLRLAVQILCKELGESGENINDDIAALVGKGMNSDVQKMLDTLRVIGNNAVHPGEINLDDGDDISISLFSLLNFIVEEMISKPKKIQEMYNIIPENLRASIDRRNERATR